MRNNRSIARVFNTAMGQPGPAIRSESQSLRVHKHDKKHACSQVSEFVPDYSANSLTFYYIPIAFGI